MFKLVDGKNHLDPIKTPLYSSSAYRGRNDMYMRAIAMLFIRAEDWKQVKCLLV